MKLSFSDSFGKMRLKLTNWEQFSLYFAQSSDVEFPDDRQASNIPEQVFGSDLIISDSGIFNKKISFYRTFSGLTDSHLDLIRFRMGVLRLVRFRDNRFWRITGFLQQLCYAIFWVLKQFH